MGFLDKPISELSLAELQRLIRQEVSAQVPAIPAGVLALADLDNPLIPPDNPTNAWPLVYSASQGDFISSGLSSASTVTDGITPTIGTVTVQAGPGFIRASWAVAGATADPCAYKVYIRAGSAPTTADGTYLLGTTTALGLVMNTIADGTTQLQFGTTYHVKVIAVSLLSGGGTSAASVDATGTPAAIDGVVTTFTNIQAGTITAGDIAAARFETNFLTAAQATITTLSSIVANIGTITSGTITGTTIQTAPVNSARMVLDSASLRSLDGSNATIWAISATTGLMTTGNLSNLSANLGTITAGTVQGTTIQTAAVNNARMVLDSTSLRALDASNATLWAISATTGLMTTGTHASISTDLGAITAGTITGATVQTAASGQRVYLDTAGLHLVDTSNNVIIDLPTDSTKTSVFTGSVSVGTLTNSTSGTPWNLGGTGSLVSAGPVTPTNPPNLSVANGGSLVAHDYWVSYSWATANELRDQNQADFEKDATTGINKINGAETVTLDSTNTVSGYTPNALKVVTTAVASSGVYLGNSVASATVTHDAPVTAGLVYTFSVYLMMVAGGSNVKLGVIWKDAAGAAVGSTQLNTSFAISTTAMTRYNVVTGAAPAGAVYATMEIITQAATATTFWADQAQFEVAGAPTTWAPVQETPTYAPAIKVTTAGSNLTANAVIPASPDAKATKCRIYMSNSATFNAGGGIYQQSATVSTSATTTVALSSAYTSTGMASKSANTWGFWSNGFVLPNSLGATSAYIRPAQYLDSASAQQGWTLEGNGRIRFVGPTLNTQFYVYDEFVYGAPSYGATGTGFGPYWNIVLSGTGATVTASTSSSVNPGVMSVRTGTTTTGSADVKTGTAFATGVARLRCSFYFAVNATPTTGAGGDTYNINLGLADTGSGTLLTSAANGIVFRFKADNVAAPVLQLAVSNSSALTAQDSSGATLAANTFVFVEFEVDAGRTAVNWWVNFVKQTPIATNIPPSTAVMVFRQMIVKTATGSGTTTRNLLVDTCSLYGDYVSG